jgi:positive regulator of sigma E activity
MKKSQQDSASSKMSYYEKKQVPPLDGCIGLIFGSLFFMIIGLTIGEDILSFNKLILITLSIFVSILLLWIIKKYKSNMRERSHFAIQTTIIAVFFFWIFLVIAYVFN